MRSNPLLSASTACLVSVAALLASPSVSAQRASLADRVATLEQRAAGDRGNVDLLNQVNQLKSEVAALRAQIEELQQQQEQAQSSARAQYLDLDGRLNRMEGGAPSSPAVPDAGTPAASAAASRVAAAPVAPPPAAGGTAASLPPPSADERAAYDTAFGALKAGRYDESARLFAQFLQVHPQGAYAANARYWLGESYYVTQNYALALDQFRALHEAYPTHDKAPGALLKVGLSQYGLRQMGEAEATLTQVMERYPGTDAARTADDRLRAIALHR